MKVDYELARQILEEEVNESRVLQSKEPWIGLITALSNECKSANKTMIAAAGTALLAKATHLDVDVFSLQVGEGKSGSTYSARALCKEVLAAEANRLGIDLGVTGREPLNNQPFFGKARISAEMPVRSTALGALKALISLLSTLDEVRTQKEARAALRCFVQLREKKRSLIAIQSDLGDDLDAASLLKAIKEFVASDSESGRRAQAVAAGILDVLFSNGHVKVERVNNPSRDYPGDVAVFGSSNDDAPERIYEVRDKPVSESDLQSLVESARRCSITKVGMVAVAVNQEILNVSGVTNWAETRNIRLKVFFGWSEILDAALCWSALPGLAVGAIYRSVLKRIEEMEVSEAGQAFWRSVVS